MQPQLLDDYFSALERLKKGIPKNVSKGVKITNDAVALEAGRGKGTIKKSRSVFANLIQAINEAAVEQAKPKNAQKEHLNKAKEAAAYWRRMLESALSREISLLHELFEIKKKLSSLTGDKVLPLRGNLSISEKHGDLPPEN